MSQFLVENAINAFRNIFCFILFYFLFYTHIFLVDVMVFYGYLHQLKMISIKDEFLQLNLSLS